MISESDICLLCAIIKIVYLSFYPHEIHMRLTSMSNLWWNTLITG